MGRRKCKDGEKEKTSRKFTERRRKTSKEINIEQVMKGVIGEKKKNEI